VMKLNQYMGASMINRADKVCHQDFKTICTISNFAFLKSIFTINRIGAG